MSFSFPQFLWAFGALLIPVLIHLFNLRRPKLIYFSNTQLLKNLELNTRSSRRLKHWLVLGLRMLALSALILAFAQPQRNTVERPNSKPSFALYLDNSYSLQKSALGGDGLSLVKNRAAELLQSIDPQSEVQLYTNDQALSKSLTPKEALEIIETIDYSAAFVRLKDLLARMAKESPKAKLFLFSDFQKSSLPRPDEALPDSLKVYLAPIAHLDTFQNASIDSLWLKSPFQNPNFVQELGLRLSSFMAQNLKLKLYLNDTLSAQKELQVEAQSRQVINFPFRISAAQFSRGRLELLRNEERIDVLYFSLKPSKKAKVLHLSPLEASNLNLGLFNPDFFELKRNSLKSVDYRFLSEANLIILEGSGPIDAGLQGQIKQHLNNGKNLLLVPGKSAQEFQLLAEQFQIKTVSTWIEDSLGGTELASQDPYFSGVFENQPRYPILPYSKKIIPWLSEQSGFPLIKLTGDQPAVVRLPQGGDVFVWLFSTEKNEGNFLSHKLLRPLLLNPALFTGGPRRLYLYDDFASYQDVRLERIKEGSLSIQLDQKSIIPPQQSQAAQVKIKTPPQAMPMGQFPILQEGDTVDFLSLNLHPLEKQGLCLGDGELKAYFGNSAVLWENEKSFQAELFNPKEAYDLWWYFILAAILFALIEILVLKRLKQ